MEDNKEFLGITEFRAKIKNMGMVFVTFALIANFLPAIYVSMQTGLFPLEQTCLNFGWQQLRLSE